MYVHSTLKLSYINMEDDASLLVKRLDDKYLSILKSWYSKSITIIDIEHLDIQFVGNEECLSMKLGSDRNTSYTQHLENKYKPTHLKSNTNKIDDCEPLVDIATEVLQVTYDITCDIYDLTGFLSCIYNYNFLNKKIFDKGKFMNGYVQKILNTEKNIIGYVQIYVNQLVLQKHLASYHYSDCFEVKGGGYGFFHRDKKEEINFRAFEDQRQSLFDIDKLGIFIPEMLLNHQEVEFFDIASHHILPIKPIIFTSEIELEKVISKPLPFTTSSRQCAVIHRPEIPIVDIHLKQEIEPIPSYSHDLNRYTSIYDTVFVSHVILNYYDYSTFILTKDLTCNEEIILTEFQEYGFIKLFSYRTKNKTIFEQINIFFGDKPCQTPDIINKNLLMIEKYISLFGNNTDNEKSIFEDEEIRITQFIQNTFIIDHSIENKIKASKIYQRLFTCIKKNRNNLVSDEVNMRKRISTYLKKLGLQKKRYSDGYYYYGIQFKVNSLIVNPYDPLII